jgi:hypothetical protein
MTPLPGGLVCWLLVASRQRDERTEATQPATAEESECVVIGQSVISVVCRSGRERDGEEVLGLGDGVGATEFDNLVDLEHVAGVVGPVLLLDVLVAQPPPPPPPQGATPSWWRRHGA